MKSVGAILTPPLLCVGLLAGIYAERASHTQPADAEPYHVRVKAALETMDSDRKIGSWVGNDAPIPTAALNLLKPNVIFSRNYVDMQRGGHRDWAQVLIVQVRDSRHMVGHYPENCYVNSGEELEKKVPRDWVVGDRKIPGTEYYFTKTFRGRVDRRCVYNFLIVPGKGIVRDIEGLNEAAENYQQRYFGAAQFQVLMSADLEPKDRDRIFATLLGEGTEVLDAMTNVDVQR